MNSAVWKIALRTLARDKTYAFLNVAGLAARAHPVSSLRYE